jgi:hypothetical protein
MDIPAGRCRHIVGSNDLGCRYSGVLSGENGYTVAGDDDRRCFLFFVMAFDSSNLTGEEAFFFVFQPEVLSFYI